MTIRRPQVSAVVPTIGRPASLAALLSSLRTQTHPPQEILVADGSDSDKTRLLVANFQSEIEGCRVQHIGVRPPNAVRQREAAIACARGEYLLLLDDDVVLERECTQKLLGPLEANADVVATTAMIRNQPWPQPTRLWRAYLRYWLRLHDGSWQGRVVGPLLRFGYNPQPSENRHMEWLATGTSLVRRAAFERAGGFSDFFLHRCTTHEDVDLGIRLSRLGRILLIHDAFLEHNHDALGRVSPRDAAADDVFNRFMVMRHTQRRSSAESWRLILTYAAFSAAGEALRVLRTGDLRHGAFRLLGIVSALWFCRRNGMGRA
jgi:GT2 family glycosyltransferase